MKRFIKGPCRPQCRSWFRSLLVGLVAHALFFGSSGAEESSGRNKSDWLSKPLSLADALNLTLQNNRTILKSASDLEAAHGVSLQVRAVAIPKLQVVGNYTVTDRDALEAFVPGQDQAYQSWNTRIQIVQSLYEGGRILSSIRVAKLTREQAILAHQSVIADTLLTTRVAYYDILLAAQDIVVREASVDLLSKELVDQQKRFDSGMVPRFNVLRAEVAVANAKPPLIRARNNHRIAKNNLVNLLGYDLPRDVWEDIPMVLTDTLEVGDYAIKLPDAVSQALTKRTELGALRKLERLREEDITTARSGRLPTVQGYGGWGWRNRSFSTDITDTIDGWDVGARATWSLFDGFQTSGKVVQAKAAHEKSKVELDETSSRIELEVRTAYSIFIQAREVLESQKKVQEQAEEALRLANTRAETGTSTQLDVLNAETALTEARTTQIQAKRDYAVAVARLERAMGGEGQTF